MVLGHPSRQKGMRILFTIGPVTVYAEIQTRVEARRNESKELSRYAATSIMNLADI
ncbi:hypothetical protein XYCOK13_26420 [Xylanibacillus composti]|uniref:Uncharacterized protein n=1 Tax=Xylanibacillus composti TaxID=1572762 RepID=A0A8J4H6U1_9BACL|nr:hypothetical protein XYCOK13_26420 [Xylanibacillus composti]